MNLFFQIKLAAYEGDYHLKPGKVTVESWLADILLKHGYGLSAKPAKGVESYERKRSSADLTKYHKKDIDIIEESKEKSTESMQLGSIFFNYRIIRIRCILNLLFFKSHNNFIIQIIRFITT